MRKFLSFVLFAISALLHGGADSLSMGYGTPLGDLSSTPHTNTLGNLFTFIFGLAVVFGLLFVFLWALKKFTVQGRRISQLRDQSKILEIIPLNAKNSLVIVKTLESIYVLGMTADRVDLIDKVTEPEILEKVNQSIDSVEPIKFLDVMKKFGKKE